jgi:hypothetical protein
MIVRVDTSETRAVRNTDNVPALYDPMINKKKSEKITAKLLSPACSGGSASLRMPDLRLCMQPLSKGWVHRLAAHPEGTAPHQDRFATRRSVQPSQATLPDTITKNKLERAFP